MEELLCSAARQESVGESYGDSKAQMCDVTTQRIKRNIQDEIHRLYENKMKRVISLKRQSSLAVQLQRKAHFLHVDSRLRYK
jgi:hypothetical protein